MRFGDSKINLNIFFYTNPGLKEHHRFLMMYWTFTLVLPIRLKFKIIAFILCKGLIIVCLEINIKLCLRHMIQQSNLNDEK